MRIYVSGPMRGIEEFNFPAFHDAARRLRELGYEVVSPAEHDLENGFDPSHMTGTEDLSEVGFDLRVALAWDVDAVTMADAVCLLDGWENSSGARAELAVAAALGLYAGTLEEISKHGVTAKLASDYFGTLTVNDEPAGYLVSPSGTGVCEDDWKAGGETRLTSQTGGQKGTKLARFDLLPAGPLWQIAEHYGKGASKYADRNWELGYDWSLSFAAMQRHLWAFWGGEDIDPETGSPHLAAAAFHVLALLEYANTHPEFDNRPKGGGK